ncbi:unnamed protein product, partial [Musa textilis]
MVGYSPLGVLIRNTQGKRKAIKTTFIQGMGSPHHIVDISEIDTSVHELETAIVHGKLDRSAPEQLHLAGTNVAQPKAESSTSFEGNPLFQTPNIMVKAQGLALQC